MKRNETKRNETKKKAKLGGGGGVQAEAGRRPAATGKNTIGAE